MPNNPNKTMRKYHDPQGLGDLPAENFEQSDIGLNIVINYYNHHRKYKPMVRQTIDLNNKNAYQPDVCFYQKNLQNKAFGVAIVVIEIEDDRDFKRCQARCQQHLAMNPQTTEAFAYNFDKHYWYRYTQGLDKAVRSSYSDVLGLYLNDLK